MGCDIHCHVEVKVKGVWHHWSTPEPGRDYELFEKMAGARGDENNAIAPPRGIPSDASPVTRFAYDFEGDDAHTPSWLSASEVGLIQKWYAEKDHPESGFKPYDDSIFGDVMGQYFNDLDDADDEYLSELKEAGFEDARLVFWFDN
jgi:hypothetical protein